MVRHLVLSLIVGVLALAAAGLGLTGVKLGVSLPSVICYGTAVGLGVVAVWLLTRATGYDTWIMRNASEIKQEIDEVSELEPIRVSVEDPETFDQFKSIADDCGFAAFMPSVRLILIEGVRFRQLIRAEDLVETYDQEAVSVKSVALEYLVGSPSGQRKVASITLSSAIDDARLKFSLAACLAPLETPDAESMDATKFDQDMQGFVEGQAQDLIDE
ncbi:MAG: hypothetical protein AAGA25_11410 [Planctomycetota bacterium]